jgi:hypothetical protein
MYVVAAACSRSFSTLRECLDRYRSVVVFNKGMEEIRDNRSKERGVRILRN